MKKRAILLLFVLTCRPELYGQDDQRISDQMSQNTPKEGEIFELDRIEAVVIARADAPGPMPDSPVERQVSVITSLDLRRPSLSGRPMNLEERIQQELADLAAKRYKIMADDEAVDKYLEMIAKSNNLKPDDMKKVFSSAGYTFEEGKLELGKMQRSRVFVHHEIGGDSMMVPRKLVQEYWENHPEMQETQYSIQYALVPFSFAQSRTDQLAGLTQYAQSGFGLMGVTWSEPFWVEKADVSEEKQFIFNLKKDEISMPQEVQQGFELYRMKEVKEPTLEERYNEIISILRQPVLEKKQQELHERLAGEAAIIHPG